MTRGHGRLPRSSASSPDIRAALDAFRAAAHTHAVLRLRLEPGDALVIDNRRILHGRTAITGSRDRHLVRRWIAAER